MIICLQRMLPKSEAFPGFFLYFSSLVRDYMESIVNLWSLAFTLSIMQVFMEITVAGN